MADEYKLAKHIVVERGERREPRITIDGEVFPRFTAGIVTPAPSLDESPTVTITILADRVTMVNEEPHRYRD